MIKSFFSVIVEYFFITLFPLTFVLFIISHSAELREAVKNGNYLAVKRALGSKEDYNLDQEVCFIFLSYLLHSVCTEVTKKSPIRGHGPVYLC